MAKKKETENTPLVVQTFDMFSQFMDKTDGNIGLSVKLTGVIIDAMMKSAMASQNEKEAELLKSFGIDEGKLS